MYKKILLFVFVFFLIANTTSAKIKNPFFNDDDARSKEIKYQYDVLKNDAKKQKEKRLYNRKPTGYMTVDEYETLSEYKDKSNIDYIIPKIETPSDFKYIPKPLYSIVKYNIPAGNAELSLGKRLFIKRQINAQGIVSPDYTKLVYPAVYYYPDSASVACDVFVIPLSKDDTNLNKILKANVANRLPDPIISTTKAIDNYASFRTLTPVDFSSDGNKILVKEKIGSSEDGIWQTGIYIYDFENEVKYDLREIRDSVVYYWKEYRNVNLESKRWDIVPLGFDDKLKDRIIVQAYAYTGEKPVYLGAWSVDCYGCQSRLESLDKDYTPKISANGFKLIRDGVESYQTTTEEQKSDREQTKELIKQYKNADKQKIKDIDQDYKYELKSLEQDEKDELRDYKKLRSLSGSTEQNNLNDKYNKYLETQLQKDIDKTEKQLKKSEKELEKIMREIEKFSKDFEKEPQE